MPEKIVGWIAMAIFVGCAIGFPLVLAGVPRSYIWPISLVAAAAILIARPGGTTERFLTGLFAYALVFAVWCVAGVLVAALLHLLVGLQRPDTIFVVFAVGAYGVYREIKTSKNPPPANPGDA